MDPVLAVADVMDLAGGCCGSKVPKERLLVCNRDEMEGNWCHNGKIVQVISLVLWCLAGC